MTDKCVSNKIENMTVTISPVAQFILVSCKSTCCPFWPSFYHFLLFLRALMRRRINSNLTVISNHRLVDEWLTYLSLRRCHCVCAWFEKRVETCLNSCSPRFEHFLHAVSHTLFAVGTKRLFEMI